MPARGLAIRGVAAAALTAVLAVGAVRCSSSAGDTSSGEVSERPRQEQPAAIAVTGFRFEPDALEVEVGDEVVWNNEDNVTHTATGESFDLELDGVGSEASFTFTAPGTYDYLCSVHESMTGQIVVD